MKLKKLNRLKQQCKPTVKHWCDHCDRYIVDQKKKCPVCGRKNRKD